MNEIKNLKPFPRFCCSIGYIPTSYKVAMTYEEQLLWLCDFLENEVIPTVNQNGQAVEELQNLYIELKQYVDNYFDNLDVQEEINNKLDEMVEQGTLQEIIADYLNSKAVFGFDTVADLKASTNLINGSYAKTLGYHSKNDGGSALYKIRTITNDDTVDDMFIIEMTNDNTLIAELIINELYAEQIGAYGDNVHDDTETLQAGIDYCTTNHIVFKSKGDKTFLITSSLNFNNKIDVDFNGSSIITNSAIDMFVFNYVSGNEYQGYLKNVVIDMNSVATIGIRGVRIIKKLISGITIKNISNIGYQIDLGNEVIFENSHFYGTSNTSIGLMLNKGDCHYKDLIMIDVHNAIYTKSSNFFTRIHAWIKTPALLNDSIFFKSDTTNESYLNQCYSDTYYKAFQIERYHRLKISEHYNHYNTSILDTTALSNIGGNVYVFYYTDVAYSQFTCLLNSIIEGLSYDSSHSVFCNYPQNQRLLFIDSLTRLQDLDTILKSNINESINVSSSSVSLSTGKTNRIEIINNIANLSLYIHIDTQINANTNTEIVSFNSQYAPQVETLFIAPFGFANSYKISGYCFCTLATNGKLYVNSTDNLPVDARIYINKSYICNIHP